MKIVYSAPNRSHHYPYVEAINYAGCLEKFISGFSRFSPRSSLNSINDKLVRYDLFQNLYLASLKFKAPSLITSNLTKASARWIDFHSYKWAQNADAFIYYRSHGYNTAKRIHLENRKTICVMEEVNSHVEYMDSLLEREYTELGLGIYKRRIPDYSLRLKTYLESDYILCPSEFVVQSFINKGFPKEKLLKVNFGFTKPYPINLDVQYKKTTRKFRVLYVGQIHYRKGLRYAIEAFKRLKVPNKEFVIVGPKTNETGLEKVQIPSNVLFTGILKGKALMNQYRTSDVFILPSIEEGLALVQGEALTAGLPLLITSHTGGKDIIKDGREGFIVPPFNFDILSERLQHIAEDNDLRSQMSIEALNTASILGGWDIAANNLLQLLSIKVRD